MKQSMLEMAAVLPRILWVLAVVGVALVAGEWRPDGQGASAASRTDIMDAPVRSRAGLGVLEPK